MEPVVIHIRPCTRLDGVLRADGNAVAFTEAIAQPAHKDFGVVLLVVGEKSILFGTPGVNAADIRGKAVIKLFGQEGTGTESLQA